MTSVSSSINIPGAIWDNPVKEREYPDNTDDFVIEADDIFKKMTMQTRARDIKRINQYHRTITVEKPPVKEDPHGWEKTMAAFFVTVLFLALLILFSFIGL